MTSNGSYALAAPVSCVPSGVFLTRTTSIGEYSLAAPVSSDPTRFSSVLTSFPHLSSPPLYFPTDVSGCRRCMAMVCGWHSVHTHTHITHTHKHKHKHKHTHTHTHTHTH